MPRNYKMKKNIIKLAVMATLTTGLAGSLSGCIGSNAVTGYVVKFNLVAVDNRYARGGLYMLLTPVYGLTAMTDIIVFNSIEFWTGKNVINGKSHIFDTKVKTIITINGELDPSLHNAPIAPLVKANNVEKEIYSAQLNAVNENTLDFNIVYNNGETALLRGEKMGDDINFYLNGEFITTASLAELNSYAVPKA